VPGRCFYTNRQLRRDAIGYGDRAYWRLVAGHKHGVQRREFPAVGVLRRRGLEIAQCCRDEKLRADRMLYMALPFIKLGKIGHVCGAVSGKCGEQGLLGREHVYFRNPRGSV